MTKTEFMRAVKYLKSNYSYPNFLGTDEALAFWYESLQFAAADELFEACKAYMRERSEPPKISDLMDGIKAVRASKRRYEAGQRTVKCPICKDRGVIVWDDAEGRPWCKACDCTAGRTKYAGLWKAAKA